MKNHVRKEYEKESTASYKIRINLKNFKKKVPLALEHFCPDFQTGFCRYSKRDNKVMKLISENKHSVIHVGNNVDKANPLPAGGDREEKEEPGKPSILTLIQRRVHLNIGF